MEKSKIKNRNSKNIQLFRHYKLRSQDIENHDKRFYGEYNGSYDFVTCFDAVHISEDGEESSIYTWAIPADYDSDVYAGDIVKVENLDGYAEVKVVSSMSYTKSKLQHAEAIHPYCCLVELISRDYEE